MSDDNVNDGGTSDDSEFDPAQLQRLRERAKLLPVEVAPNAEAWGAIRDRIERSRVLALPGTLTNVPVREMTPPLVDADRAPLPSAKRFRTTRIVMLAAASLFVVVTTAVVVRERGELAPLATTSKNSDVIVSSAPDAPTSVASAQSPHDTTAAVPLPQLEPPVAAILAQYNAAANDLAKDFDARRARLQPDAIAVVDSCLQTLDHAIRESRDALSETPGNPIIIELLQVTYQQKLDLLRRAADLPTVSLQD